MRYLLRLQANTTFFSSVLLLSALMLSAVLSGCAKKPEVAEDIRPVRVIQLAASAQHVMAEYAGNVQPRIETRLGFRVDGKISARKVDVGSVVKAGQILMQLDPEDLRLAQAQADGNFRAAQSNLILANNELKRYQELRTTNAVSQSMLDAKVTAAVAAKGAFDQAQAQLKGQSNQAAYANLIATTNGVVTAINAEVGQVVTAGMPVMQVAQLGEMEVVVGIPENSVDIVSHASDVRVSLWANPKEIITGKLRELSPVADPATRTFTARVSIVNPSPKVIASVKMGMTANVKFTIDTTNAFIKVPLSALLQEKNVTSVWIVESGAVKLIPVKIVGVSGNDLLISSGLNAGQTLVTAGVHLLKEGQKVSVLQEAVEPIATSDSYLAAPTVIKSTPTALNAAPASLETVPSVGATSAKAGAKK